MTFRVSPDGEDGGRLRRLRLRRGCDESGRGLAGDPCQGTVGLPWNDMVSPLPARAIDAAMTLGPEVSMRSSVIGASST